MLKHLGNGCLVRERDIIGIFDLDGEVTPKATTKMLRRLEREGKCTSAVLDLPRSFILMDKNGNDSAILSHISSGALAKRGF